MKHFSIIVCAIVLTTVSTPALGDDVIVSAAQIKTKVSIGTAAAYKGFAIDIILTEAMPAGSKIDRATFRENVPSMELRSTTGDQSIPFDADEVLATNYAIQAAIEAADISEDVLEILQLEGTYIHIERPLRVPLNDGSFLVISSSALRDATESIVLLSEASKDKLVAAKGGAHTLYRNRFDFAAEVGAPDSTSRQFVVTFQFYKVPFTSMPWWTMYGSGYLSTESETPHTKLELYPLSAGMLRGVETGEPFRTFELRASAGIKGVQTLATSRANEGLYLTVLVPNVLDLTGGEARLRLKPIISLSAEMWQELDDGGVPGDLENGGKAGIDLYYYVPILDKYSALVEGQLSAPFGDIKEKYQTHDTLYRFDVTLGYQLPLESTKLVAKYSLGANDITFTYDSMFLIGLAADIFNVGGGVIPVTQ